MHAASAANPQWQYIHLTKNPARYERHPPPPGSWVGASVDEQKMVHIAEDAARRIDRAAVKWLSVEPLRDWASSSRSVREKVSMTSCASAMNSEAF